MFCRDLHAKRRVFIAIGEAGLMRNGAELSVAETSFELRAQRASEDPAGRIQEAGCTLSTVHNARPRLCQGRLADTR